VRCETTPPRYSWNGVAAANAACCPTPSDELPERATCPVRALQGNVTGEAGPIELTTSGDTVFAKLTGDFDMQATFTVEPALERALEPPGLRRIELDLHRLEFIDSTGMGVIVRVHAEARQRGIELLLRRGPPHVHRVFDKTGLADTLLFRPADGQQIA
jgi:anti-anti-sigma factor